MGEKDLRWTSVIETFQSIRPLFYLEVGLYIRAIGKTLCFRSQMLVLFVVISMEK
jgi:hypothetical protein